MLYQSLRGSANEVYRSIHSHCDIPMAWESLIQKNISAPLRYGRDGYPCHQILMVLKKDEQYKLLRSCSRQKRNALSNSYYVHSYVMDLSLKDMLNRFDETLQIAFFSEQQFDAAADELYVGAPEQVWQGSEDPINISRDVLRAVLYGMVNRWDTIICEPVVIAVPAYEDYERYTYRVVRTIYGYLPAAIRALAGFMTYVTPNEQLTNIALYFLPENCAGSGAIYLDESKGDISPLLNCQLSDAAKEMIDRIVDMSDPGKRNRFLQRLLENVEESSENILNLTSDDYTNYLEQSKLLDADAENPDVFEQWVDFANATDSVNPKIRKELLGALSNKVTSLVFDKHFLNNLLKNAEGVADLRNKMARVSPLCSLSKALSMHVNQRLEEYLDDRLRGVQTIEQVLALIRAIEGAQNEVGCFPSDEMLIRFGEKCQTKWKSFSENEMRDLVHDAKNNIKKINEASMDLAVLQKKCSGFRIRLEADLRSSRLNLEPHMISSQVRAIKVLETEKIKSKLVEVAKLRISSSQITTVEYENEKKRLSQLRNDISYYKNEFKYDLIVAFEKVTESEKSLEERYRMTGGYHNQIVAGIHSEHNYFSILEKLAQHHKDNLTSRDIDDFDVKLRQIRPSDIDGYMDQFLRHYKENLTLASAAKLDPYIGDHIKQDLADYSKQHIFIDLNRKSLQDLANEIAVYQYTYQVMVDHDPETIWLENKPNSPYKVSFTKLSNFLQGCLGRRTGEKGYISEVEAEKIVEYLSEARVLKEADFPNVASYLLYLGLREQLFKLIKQFCLGDQIMDPVNRYRLYAALESFYCLDDFLDSLPKEFECLRDEVAWYRKGSGITLPRPESGFKHNPEYTGPKSRWNVPRIVFPVVLGLLVIVIVVICLLLRGNEHNRDVSIPTNEPTEFYSQLPTDDPETIVSSEEQNDDFTGSFFDPFSESRFDEESTDDYEHPLNGYFSE